MPFSPGFRLILEVPPHPGCVLAFLLESVSPRPVHPASHGTWAPAELHERASCVPVPSPLACPLHWRLLSVPKCWGMTREPGLPWGRLDFFQYMASIHCTLVALSLSHLPRKLQLASQCPNLCLPCLLTKRSPLTAQTCPCSREVPLVSLNSRDHTSVNTVTAHRV